MLLVPACESRQGIGHLKRSIFFLSKCDKNYYLYLPLDINLSNELQISLKEKTHIIRSLDTKEKWDLIILDKRMTTKKDFNKFFFLGTVIGLDEGGGSRKYFPYLVDTPLHPFPEIKPNIISLLYQQNHHKKKDISESIKQVLISFGGEDPHNLSKRLVQVLLKMNFFSPDSITIIQGPHFKESRWPSGIKVIRNPQNLLTLIPDYDLVFTHFGITCFESISKEIPVILLNPTSYHHKLCKYYKLPCIGIKKPDMHRLKKILNHPDVLRESVHMVSSYIKGKISFPHLIQSINIKGNIGCPVCGKNRNQVIERFPDRSYFICRSCHIIYSLDFMNKPGKYDKNYFFDEYRNQYGKTYIEDFNNIKQYAYTRLAFINKIICKKKINLTKLQSEFKERKSLLDIGCAYGPFLIAAKEEGFLPEGIDISPGAVSYVKNTLNIQCRCLDFKKISKEKIGNKKYDIITMWFVLEHFIQTDVVLKKVNMSLKKGGIFAFSTPNISGISYKKNRKKYLDKNPKDHYTLWNPKAARKTLKLFGFSLVKVRITGHHPERFPFFNNYFHKNTDNQEQNRKSGLFYLFSFLSRMLRLGDTFEVYAQKIEDSSTSLKSD